MSWLFLILFSFNLGGLKEEMADPRERVRAFLKNISKVESSGGKDFSHDEMKTGIHKGTSAIGRYGLMPNTVNEVLNRMRLKGTLTPELQSLKDSDPQLMKQFLETNPQVEDQIAEELAQRVLERQQDEDMAAFSWNQGHNLTPDRITQMPYQEHDYVKKFKMYKESGEE